MCVKNKNNVNIRIFNKVVDILELLLRNCQTKIRLQYGIRIQIDSLPC